MRNTARNVHGWAATTLGDIAQWLSGGTPSKSVAAYWRGDIPWVSPKDMKVFRLGTAQDHVTESGVVAGSRLVPDGTVLLVVRGMILAHTFPVCLTTRPVAFNQDVKALIPADGVGGTWLAHWFVGNSSGMLGLVTEATHGTKRIDLDDLQRFRLNVPPLAEQRRIAAILDTLDEAIRQTEAVIAKLGQVKQGLLHDLLTRGIDHNGELRDPERHPEQFKDSPLGRIPRAWEVASLGSLATRVTDGTHQAVKTVEPSPGTVPFLYVSCVRDGRIEWSRAAAIPERTYKDISRGREPDVGMVLYTAVGSYGHAAHLETSKPFAFQRHLACIYPVQERISPALLSSWLNSPRARLHAESVALGNAQKTVTLGVLSGFPVPVPPIGEQQVIADANRRLAAQTEAEQAGLDKLRTLKQGLMDDLLTGRVRISDPEEDAPHENCN